MCGILCFFHLSPPPGFSGCAKLFTPRVKVLQTFRVCDSGTSNTVAAAAESTCKRVDMCMHMCMFMYCEGRYVAAAESDLHARTTMNFT